MKKITLFLFALFTCWQINAQVSSYAFSQSSGTYTPITGGTLAASGASLDDTILSVTLPTAFAYNGNSITTVGFSPNGYLIMGNTTTHGYTPLSSTATSNGVISGLGMDLVSNTATSELRWEQIGNEIIFQWKEFRRYLATPESINFQIRLNTSNGQINVVYDAPTTVVASETRIPQVGLRGTANADYNARRLTTSVPDATPSWNDTAAATSNAHNVRFTNTAPAAFPSSGLTFTWSPPVPCSGAPVAGTVTPALQNVCTGVVPANLVGSGYSSGVTGLTFQWEESNDDGATDAWAPVVGGTGATTATYTPPAFSGTPIYYRLNVTCTNSSSSAQTASVLVSAPITPTNQITAVTIPAGTVNYAQAVVNWTNGNGNRRVVYISNSATFTDPVNGNAPALTANTVYSGSGQQIIFDGTGTTVTVTGLATGTQYYIKAYEYVRCGSGPYDYYYNVTTGTNIGTFTTCGIYAVPALEDFTAYVPDCWQEADNGNLTTGPATFGTSSWAADGFGNVGTTGAMRVNLDFTGDNDWILSPLYTIPANYELKFDASANQWGTNPIAPTTPWEADDFVEVLVSTGTTNWNVLYTYNNTNVPSNTGTPNIIDLDAYAGQTVRFAFRGVEGGTDGGADIELIVDNFELRETPPCVEPTTLSATNITFSSADLSWVDPSGTQFDYYYVVQPAGGGVPAVAGDYVDIGDLPLTVNALSSNTNYEFWVRADCGGAGYSAWVGPFTFRTLCSAINTFPFVETFNTDSTTESCWLVVNGNADGDQWNMNGTTIPRNGQSAELYTDFNTVNNDYLVSPQLDLGTTAKRLKFWVRHYSNFEPDNLNVRISTTGRDIPSFASNNLLTLTTTQITTTYTEYIVDLSAYSGLVYIAFAREDAPADGWYVSIDDVTVEDAPTAPPVCATNVVATPHPTCGNYANSITWDVTSGADGYYVTIGTTTGGNDIANAVSVSGTSYNFTGNFNTTYFYTIVPYNANGSATGCTEQSFATNVNGCYCVSAPTSVDGLGITNVQIVSTNFANTVSTSPVYNDHTATPVDMSQGINNNVQISFDTGFGYDYNIVIWIDANDDFNLDASEIVYTGLAPNTPIVTHNASFVMPGTMPLGQHRMRIVATDALQTPSNPCYSGTYGETADFTVNIVAASCTPPAATTTVVPACGTAQYSIDVNVTALGSGTPSITDGTTSWPVSAIGVVNVGPFASGSSVTLTLLHGSDATCNLPLGSFNYACPPANDDCLNAQVLTPGGVFGDNDVVGTNVAATASTGETAPGCASYSGGDVWYQVTVPASGSLTIETNNNSSAISDTGLAVYSGSCGALVLVECDDDDSADGNFSLISLTGRTPGEVLFVRVWEYSNDAFGTFLVSTYDASLSSGSFDNANFTAYPNPVKDVLNVSYTTEISSIRVINMIGQEVISKNINATSTQVDMSQLSAGTYIVNVTVGDNVKTLKVVKQ